MTKPRKTTAAKSRKKTVRRTAPKPAAQAPAPTVEELKQEIAKFDHDGDGHPGGSLPHENAEEPEAVEPTVDAESETAEAPTAEQPEAPTADEPEADEPEAPITDARSTTVSLGPVECRLRRVPLTAVLGLLSPEGLRRIEAHKTTSSFEATRQRLLATDGRATPVIFSAPDVAGEEPTILHGYEELAAAEDCGVNDVDVILVPAGRADLVQSHIVEMVRLQQPKPASSDDDELLYRVHAED